MKEVRGRINGTDGLVRVRRTGIVPGLAPDRNAPCDAGPSSL